jgi:hypothetical protein
MLYHGYIDILLYSHDNSGWVLHQMHRYFREKDYMIPHDGSDCAFQWVLDTKKTFFEKIHGNAEDATDFNAYMSGVRINRQHWWEWYPVQQRLLSDFSFDDDSSTLLVDVGGNTGHDLQRFLRRFPESRNHLVLQDLPATIEMIHTLEDGIQAMPHDFFTSQPVKGANNLVKNELNADALICMVSGARVYYMHFVMQDWPDDACQTILTHLKDAMKPGYSRLLLNESVLPDRGCPSIFASTDITMMAVLAGVHRTVKQWIKLVESVGLEVVEVMMSPGEGDAEGVVEAIRKD